MKIVKWLLTIVILIAVLVLAFLAYMGVFFSPKVAEKEMGPYTLVYEPFIGPYSQTGKVFDKVYKELKADGIETVSGIGIYYDNPAIVKPEKLRSNCGSVVEAKDLGKLASLKNKYRVWNIPKKKCLVAEFPLRNMLSYMIGPMKAYPALMKYAGEKSYILQKGKQMAMTFELYDMKAGKIYFVMEILK